ncbi:MAG TPA: hypothetical protein VNX28_07685, partial [Gemmataceae bacterium]|nr:hypothetical protein [Gemmataceae bacterium]
MVPPDTNTYNISPTPDPPVTNNQPTFNAGQVAYLYNHYGTTLAPDADHAVALQLAIWELEYNVTPDPTLQTGNFQYTDTSPHGMALRTLAGNYVTEALNHPSENVVFLDGNPNPPPQPSGSGLQGVLAPESLNYSDIYQPSITTTPSVTSMVTLGTSSVTLTDTAVLSGGYLPDSLPSTITFTLIYTPTGGLPRQVDMEPVTVTGNGSYTTPTGYMLPTSGTVTGTYQWDASYSGDADNSPASDINNPNEQFTITPPPEGMTPAPMITTVAGGTVILGSATSLTDTATLSDGYYPTGTITFYLFAPGATSNTPYSSAVYSDTVNITGDGSYSTGSGTITGSAVPTETGTYQWVAVYNGDGNNSKATSNFGDEPVNVDTISTSQTPVIAYVGESISDTATVTGLVGGTGDTVTFNLYSSATTQDSSTLLHS